ncbi:MAG: molybdopterin molybdotransferase MoeA [Pseudomonadota bacterium]
MNAPIPLEDALAHVAAHAPAFAQETVALEQARDRILAAPVVAATTRPDAALSAMDGYAVRCTDVDVAGRTLEVIGEVPAGRPFDGSLGPGQAVRIFTGGVLPDGADHVVMQEEAERDGSEVRFAQAYRTPRFVRPKGLDFERGDRLLDSGRRLGPGERVLLAAANVDQVTVRRPLRVGIVTGGDELVPVGTPLRRGQSVDANSFGLAGMIQDLGGVPVAIPMTRDDAKSIENALAHGSSLQGSSPQRPVTDILLVVGGASIGDRDLMRPKAFALGYVPIFERVAVRPGKPSWLAVHPDASRPPILGLPGNPASAMVCARLFLSVLMARPWQDSVTAGRLDEPLPANGPRTAFLRARRHVDNDAVVRLTAEARQDSSLVTPLAWADTLIWREANAPAAAAGTRVDILPFSAR